MAEWEKKCSQADSQPSSLVQPLLIAPPVEVSNRSLSQESAGGNRSPFDEYSAGSKSAGKTQIKDYNNLRMAHKHRDVATSKSLHVSAFPYSPPILPSPPPPSLTINIAAMAESLDGPGAATGEGEGSSDGDADHSAGDLDSGSHRHGHHGHGHGHGHVRAHEEVHGWTNSDYLKAAVFGGLDGIVTLFAVVAGCVGADLTAAQILIVGLGNLLADAASMGFGEYVSAKAESDYVETEKERETWEVANLPEEEKQEMIEIYVNRYGFTIDDARSMVNISFKYPTFFISHMMVEELGLMSDQAESGSSPFKRGLVMFTSFAVFGVVPLAAFLTYAVSEAAEHDSSLATTAGRGAFYVASLASLITLFFLGVFKARFVGQTPVISGLMMMLNGSVAGALAFGIGTGLQLYVSA